MVEKIKEGAFLVAALAGAAAFAVFACLFIAVSLLAQLIVAIRYPLAAVACVWMIVAALSCGTSGDDAGDVPALDAGPDETYEACRDFLEKRAYGLECSPMGVEYDRCSGENDEMCYRPEYWRCMARGLRCRPDGTITEDALCETTCLDRDADAGVI